MVKITIYLSIFENQSSGYAAQWFKINEYYPSSIHLALKKSATDEIVCPFIMNCNQIQGW